MKKPYTNKTDHIQHIGSVTLFPGDTREVEEIHLKGHKLDAGSGKEKSTAPEISVVAQIRADSIKKIAKQLPDFTIETINDLEAAEKADDKPRTGLLNAITEERLRRSASAGDEEKAALENFIKSLDGMSEPELIQQGSDFAGDENKAAYLDAVNEELAERKALADKAELDTFIDSLAEMNDDDLQASKDLYSEKPEDEAYLQAVNTEIENRAKG